MSCFVTIAFSGTKQTRSDGSIVIYAGAQEVDTKAGLTTVKTYWPYGVGVEIDRPGATNSELSWMHLDRLGSPVALSDSTGALREKLAYDAWGKRRTLDGAPINGTPTPDSIDGATDNRGFTGHEMLDNLDLVHMNGRVYDPFIGKFLSADPLIQDPINGQSYNRYSYVLNNPTNFTDPTGFACAENTTGSNICNTDVAKEWGKGFNNLSVENQAQLIAIAGINTVNSALKLGGFKPNDAKNPNANPAVPGCIGPCVQKTEGNNNTTIGPIQRSGVGGWKLNGQQFADSVVGEMLADIVKPLALFTKNNVNPISGIVENFSGDKKAEAVILLMSLGINGEMRGGAALAKKAEKTIYVLGRQIDTTAAKDWAGHRILDIKNWTLAKNDAFIDKIIGEKATACLDFPQTSAALWDAANNRMTVFAQELLGQLTAAGYKQVENYMVPGK